MASRQQIRQAQAELTTELNRIKTTSRQVVVWGNNQIALKRQRDLLIREQRGFIARKFLWLKEVFSRFKAAAFFKQ